MNVTAPASTKRRKLIIQLVGGMIVGAASSLMLLRLFDGAGFDLDDPSRVLAFAEGLVLALVGIAAGIGVLAPGAGSKWLNVEDADELREQRRPLGASAMASLLIGIALILLAASGTVFDPVVAAIFAGIAFFGAWAIGLVGTNRSDEMMRSVGRDAGALAAQLATGLAAAWAIAAALGHEIAVPPLGVLAGLCLIQIVAALWVIARRGMMAVR